MRRILLALAVVCVSAAVAPARAEEERPPKPYQPVAVKLPPAVADESFVAFRQELAAAAKGRVYAELTRLTVAHGFFWERDFDRRFDPRKPPRPITLA